MKTDQHHEPTRTVFLQTVSVAVAQLKQQLQRDYEQAYPDLAEIVHLVLDEEESRARSLTMFPHLLLPDLVEAHVEQLSLRPAETKHDDVFAPRVFHNIDYHEPVYACA